MDDVVNYQRREYQRRQEEILVEQKRLEKEAKLSNPNKSPKPVSLQKAKPEWFSKNAKNQLVVGDGKYKSL